MLKPYNKAQIHFDIKERISAEGQNSEVFLVKDHQLDAELVVKRLAKTSLGNQDEYFQESKILYLSAHPNVVQIHYACEDNDNIYIAMPFYRNGSLKQLMDTRFLTLREILRYSFHFLTGLQNIHSKRLIHFDIKPDNILLSDRNEALLSDFGLAKLTSPAGIAGQDRWYQKQRPPEAFSGDHFTLAFDIYQVGVTLYRLCNGNEMFYEQYARYGDRANFNREQYRYDVTNGKFPDRDRFCLHIPDKLVQVVRKCLEPNPDNRFKSCIEISNALAAIDGKELDWQYSEDHDGRKLTKIIDDKCYIMEIDSSGNAKTTKTTGSGITRNINAYCKKNISCRDIKKLLRTL